MGCGPRLLFIQLWPSATFAICHSEFSRPISEYRVRGGHTSSPSCSLDGHKDGVLTW
ncbi:hypothetical protein M9X92_011770 [Pyricularia oryzae]|nr:hypothetical protein M9X92_011770 [Pyricularia oryzae]